MMCYKDMCFCPFSNTCTHGEVCFRALTKKIEDDAKLYGLPLDLMMDKPDCYNKIILN